MSDIEERAAIGVMNAELAFSVRTGLVGRAAKASDTRPASPRQSEKRLLSFRSAKSDAAVRI